MRRCRPRSAAPDVKGVWLACLGVLILTPDAALIRLSGLDAAPLVAWRGLCLGLLFLATAVVTGQIKAAPRLFSMAGGALILAQWANATLFATGIALAPAALVLIAVATVPIWAAVLSRLVYNAPTGPATWATIAVVSVGIAFAMGGTGHNTGHPAAIDTALIGVGCGLGVALSLALTFTLLRHRPDIPMLPAVGAGALLAGITGLSATSVQDMSAGTTWAIAVTSLFVLPTSFYLMSQAARYTASVNVSLVLLLEAVLGPFWVWVVIGETPSLRLVLGGAVVVAALAAYLWYLRHSAHHRRA